jgi:hypothetical protein
VATALWLCHRRAADRAGRVAATGLLLLAGALASPSFWQHHFVVLAVAGAGLWRVLAAASPRRRVLLWAAAVTPLVATITLPYAVEILAAGPESEWYRGLREYGLPTAGAVVFFLVAAVATTSSVARARQPLARSS